jgi:hypothetical protein
MLAFEWGAILLYSWIDVIWADPAIRHTRVEFNTVGDPLMRPVLETLQRAVGARHPSPPMVDQPVDIEPLFYTSMKFYNMLNSHALLRDERVYAYCFEPTFKPKWFWRHGREGLLWAVTSDHSLFIREPYDFYPYGAVFTFCPRGEIRDARIVATEQDAEVQMTVGEAGFKVKGAFSLDRQAELTAGLQLLTGQQVTA